LRPCALSQVAALTRLHSLRLGNYFYKSHQYASLAALSSTLQSLTLDKCDGLPDCLPKMLALRTLVRGQLGPAGVVAAAAWPCHRHCSGALVG